MKPWLFSAPSARLLEQWLFCLNATADPAAAAAAKLAKPELARGVSRAAGGGMSSAVDEGAEADALSAAEAVRGEGIE